MMPQCLLLPTTRLLSLAAVLIGAVIMANIEAVTQNGNKYTVNVGFFKEINPFDPAIANRYYDFTASDGKEYEVVFYILSQGIRAMAGLDNGELDVTSSGSSPFSLGSGRGLDIETFTLIDKIEESQGMVAQYGRDIKSPRDLVGKAVGTPFGSTAHFNSLWAIEVLQLPYVVHSRPVCRLPTDPAYVSGCTGCSLPNPSPDCDPSKVNLFHISPEDMKAAWDKGELDAANVWEPSYSYIFRDVAGRDDNAAAPYKHGFNLLSTGSLSRWGKFTFTCIATTRTFADAHPELLTRITKVMDLLETDFYHNNYLNGFPTPNPDPASLGWTANTKWIQDVVDVDLGEELVGTDPVGNSYNIPNRLAANYVPSLDHMLDQTTCEWMSCGIEGGIAKQVLSHNLFHFDNKNLAYISDSVYRAENIQTRFLSDARSNPLTLADLVSKSYGTKGVDYYSQLTSDTPNRYDVPGANFCTSGWANAVVLTGATGTITDGHGEGGSYQQASNCFWVIKPNNNANSIVRITFTFFNIEGSYDFVNLFEGEDVSGRMLAHFTGGTGLERSIRVRGPVTVQFITDNVPHATYKMSVEQGFTATYDTQGCTSDADCGGTSQGTCGASGVCECQQGYYDAACSTSEFCIGTVHSTANSGGVSHGTAPMYNNAAKCGWLLQPANGDLLVLSFSTFEVEEGKDYVNVYDGVDANSGALIGSFTGASLPPTIKSGGSAVFVELVSDQLSRRSGFALTYSTVSYAGCRTAADCTNNGVCSSGECVCDVGYFGSMCSSEFCMNDNGVSTSSTGTIKSQRDTTNGKYQNKANCVWALSPEPLALAGGGTAPVVGITLSFNVFQLELANDVLQLSVLDAATGEPASEPVHTLTMWSAECRTDSMCSYPHGTCDVPTGQTSGTCVCEDGYHNGDCSLKSLQIASSGGVQLRFSSDVNVGGAGISLAYSTLYACPGFIGGAGDTLDPAYQCSAHGSCEMGVCTCDEEWTGTGCGTAVKRPCSETGCGDYASCGSDTIHCDCDSGYDPKPGVFPDMDDKRSYHCELSRASEAEKRVFWGLSTCINMLSFVMAAYTVAQYQGNDSARTSAMLSYLSVLLPDMLRAGLNFVVNLTNVLTGELVEGGTCNAIGFLTFLSVVVTFCAPLLVGRVTQAKVVRLKNYGRDEPFSVATLLGFLALPWCAGVIFAAVAGVGGKLGSYRGLTCYVTAFDSFSSGGLTLLTLLCSVVGAAVVILGGFGGAGGKQGGTVVMVGSSAAGGGAKTSTRQIKSIKSVERHSSRIMFVLFGYWSFFVVATLINLFGGAPPVWLDMVGGLGVSLQPLVISHLILNTKAVRLTRLQNRLAYLTRTKHTTGATTGRTGGTAATNRTSAKQKNNDESSYASSQESSSAGGSRKSPAKYRVRHGEQKQPADDGGGDGHQGEHKKNKKNDNGGGHTDDQHQQEKVVVDEVEVIHL